MAMLVGASSPRYKSVILGLLEMCLEKEVVDVDGNEQ